MGAHLEFLTMGVGQSCGLEALEAPTEPSADGGSLKVLREASGQ
jgi:hypothetical protein